MSETCPLARTAENALARALELEGYIIQRKGGKVWGDALCVSTSEKNDDTTALVCLENAGETDGDHLKILDEQQSLEGAGRACHRVDFLSLALNFTATIDDVRTFLNKSGLSKPKKRTLQDAMSTVAAKKAKMPSGEEVE